MKLQYSPNSPYVRKVVMLALELGLDDKITRQALTLSPYEPNPEVTALNPLGKIPVLVADDGEVLFDSIVACEYLSVQAGDHMWFPPAGSARWSALRTNALADGVLEAAQLARFESIRPEAVRHAPWMEAQLAKVIRSAIHLDRALPANNDIGAIAAGCALAWVDFRFPDLNWRSRAPVLATWFDAFAQRPSFQSTRHPGQ